MQFCKATEEDSACLWEETDSKHDIFQTVRHGRHAVSQMGI